MLFTRPGIVGAVDTLAYTQAERLRDQYHCFVLIRDMGEIERSSARCGVSYLAPRETFARATVGLPAIKYRDLHDVRYLEYIWTLLVGDGFDAPRARQLLEMNIQRDLKRMTERVPELAHCIN